MANISMQKSSIEVYVKLFKHPSNKICPAKGQGVSM